MAMPSAVSSSRYIDQSQEFALCAVVLAYPVFMLLRNGKIWQALLLVAIAVSFIATWRSSSCRAPRW